MAAKVPDLQRAIETVNETSGYKIDGLPVRVMPNLYNQRKKKWIIKRQSAATTISDEVLFSFCSWASSQAQNSLIDRKRKGPAHHNINDFFVAYPKRLTWVN